MKWDEQIKVLSLCNVKVKEATNANDIPKYILIGSNEIVCGYFSDMFNENESKSHFTEILKTEDINPHFKNDDSICKVKSISNLNMTELGEKL